MSEVTKDGTRGDPEDLAQARDDGAAPAAAGATELPAAEADSPILDASPTRFAFPTRYPRWLRIFIFLFVADMVCRGVLGGIVEDKWTKELSLTTLPKGLPTSPELQRIRSGKGTSGSVAERYWQTASSVAAFYDPTPTTVTRGKIRGAGDWAKYSLTWVRTRLRFVGKITMLNHSWPMFSPNTRRARAVVRSTLVYADGTTLDHYPFNEPRSFTSYSRWFVKRPQKIDERLDTHENARIGMANYLSNQHPRSKGGAALKAIEMRKILYRFPRIGDDVRKHWARIRKAAEPELIWRYDAATRKGKRVATKSAKDKTKRRSK